MLPKIVLCIPGIWSAREDFLRSLVTASNARYIAAGIAILDTETKDAFGFEFHEFDDRMFDSFSYASRRFPLNKEEQEDLRNHKSVLYVTSENSGLETIKSISNLASSILEAGGIAVKNEVAGCAVSKETWAVKIQACSNKRALYDLFVFQFVRDEFATFTIGLTQFGAPDFIIETEDQELGSDTASVLLNYLAYEDPVFESGQTFSVDDKSPKWRISKVDHIYLGNSHIDYSLGAFKLAQATQQKPKESLLKRFFG